MASFIEFIKMTGHSRNVKYISLNSGEKLVVIKSLYFNLYSIIPYIEAKIP